MTRAHKVDGNQAAIVKALRQAGCSVAVTSGVANGFPDLCVARKGAFHGKHSCGGQTYLLEVKRNHSAKLTPDQVKFRDAWKGPIFVVTSVDEAMIACGIA